MPTSGERRQSKLRIRTLCATAPRVKIIEYPGIRRACQRSAQSEQLSQHGRNQCEGTRLRNLSARQTEAIGIRLDPGNLFNLMARNSTSGMRKRTQLIVSDPCVAFCPCIRNRYANHFFSASAVESSSFVDTSFDSSSRMPSISSSSSLDSSRDSSSSTTSRAVIRRTRSSDIGRFVVCVYGI